jgi:hypothetical protein
MPDVVIYWYPYLKLLVDHQKLAPKVDTIVSDYGGVADKPYEELAKVNHPNKIITSAETRTDCPFPFVPKLELAAYLYANRPRRRSAVRSQE